MTEHISGAVYVELGAAGLDIHKVRALISEAAQLSSDLHQMGAQGKVAIPGTKRVLVYDCGIDGMDYRVYIEDAEVKTADELVEEAVKILSRHDRSTYSGGPNFYEWRIEANRYLTSRDAKK